jgi:N-dimethylarginine dimethylaminohydrolase
MKPEHRRGERALWMEAAHAMGMDTASVEGTWEAQGDVAFFRGELLLFFGGRTTRKGTVSAAKHLAPGTDARAPIFVEIREPAFHGNMALLPLAHADRLLVCREVVGAESLAALARAFGEERLLDVTTPEIRAYATNGLPIGDAILVPHLTPERIVTLLRELGLDVVVLPMVELCEKAGGASRCLVSHATVDDGAVHIPAALDYRMRRDELLRRLPRGVVPSRDTSSS